MAKKTTKLQKIEALLKKGLSKQKIAKKLKCPIGHVHSAVWKLKQEGKVAVGALVKDFQDMGLLGKGKPRKEAVDTRQFEFAIKRAEELEAQARAILVEARLIRENVRMLADLLSADKQK